MAGRQAQGTRAWHVGGEACQDWRLPKSRRDGLSSTRAVVVEAASAS